VPCAALLVAVCAAIAAVLYAHNNGISAQRLPTELSAAATEVCQPLTGLLTRLRRRVLGPPTEEDMQQLLSALLGPGEAGMWAPEGCSSVPRAAIDDCAEWHGCLLSLQQGRGPWPRSLEKTLLTLLRHGTWFGLHARSSAVTVCGRSFSRSADGWSRDIVTAENADAAADFARARQADAGYPGPAHQTGRTSSLDGDNAVRRDRQQKIRAAALAAWAAYCKLAWGSDELVPLSGMGIRGRDRPGSTSMESDQSQKQGKTWGRGVQITEALDTLLVFGASDEVARGREWVAGNSTDVKAYGQKLDLDQDATMRVAELSSQLVSGLLSAHTLGGGALFLQAATIVGGRLLPAFDTPSGLPLPWCNLGRAVCQLAPSTPANPRGDPSAVEAAVPLLELAALADASSRSDIAVAVRRATAALLDAADRLAALATLESTTLLPPFKHGLVPALVSIEQIGEASVSSFHGSPDAVSAQLHAERGGFVHHATAGGVGGSVSYGGRHGTSADGYYDSLLKLHLWYKHEAARSKHSDTAKSDGDLTNLLARRSRSAYLRSVEGIRRHLARRYGDANDDDSSTPRWYLGELVQGHSFYPAFSQLSCRLPATLALGHLHGLDDAQGTHIKFARRLAHSCFVVANRTATGLPPDLVWLGARPTESGLDWHTSAEGDNALFVESQDAFSPLRSGLAESLYFLWLATDEQQFVDYGWQIFEAIEGHASVGGAFATVDDVSRIKTGDEHDAVNFRDEMKPWLLGQTFQWLWLLVGQQAKVVQGASLHPGAEADILLLPTSNGHFVRLTP
jgi:hypothetical protein